MLESKIGFVDVKSEPVQFYVQRETNFKRPAADGAMPFEIEIVNNGAAMKLTTGIFTAPKSGTYFFDFSAVGLPDTGVFSVIFYVDGLKKASALIDDVSQFSVSLPIKFNTAKYVQRQLFYYKKLIVLNSNSI